GMLAETKQSEKTGPNPKPAFPDQCVRRRSLAGAPIHRVQPSTRVSKKSPRQVRPDICFRALTKARRVPGMTSHLDQVSLQNQARWIFANELAWRHHLV